LAEEKLRGETGKKIIKPSAGKYDSMGPVKDGSEFSIICMRMLKFYIDARPFLT
jgi:hypothetical protein